MFRDSYLSKVVFLSALCLSNFTFAGTTEVVKGATGTSKVAESNEEVQVDMKVLSKAFGNFIGKNIKATPGLQFDVDALIQGIRDGDKGEPSPLSDKEYEKMMVAMQEKAIKEVADKNLKAANEFLAKNSKEPGVKELIPGQLQYLVLTEGSGEEVKPHASPKINYVGKYKDGTVFGSSEEMGGPITIPLDQTIAGFSKGIVGMKEGGKRRLFVHPDLGYGTTGQLPPNELLVFDIEVIKASTDDEKNEGSSDSSSDSSDSSDKNSDTEDDLFIIEEDEFDISPAKKSS